MINLFEAKLDSLNYTYDTELISSVLLDMYNHVRDDYSYNQCRLAFLNEKFKYYTTVLVTHTPIVMIPVLRTLGLNDIMVQMIDYRRAYQNLNVGKYRFENMFILDNQPSLFRALINQVMSISSEYILQADKYENIKIRLYNKLLQLAITLKDTIKLVPYYVSYDEVIQLLIDICFCDKIGNGETGEIEFYNRFVSSYPDENILVKTGDHFIKTVSELTDIGRNLMLDLEDSMYGDPDRIRIYLNLKITLFRYNNICLSLKTPEGVIR